MITALMLFAAVSPYNTFHDTYLYPNYPNIASYSLVTVQKLQQDQYQLNSLTDHNGMVCSKQYVHLEQLNKLTPFHYGRRVYVNSGYSTKSGTVVGQIQNDSLVHFEGKPCEEYASLVPTDSIIPLN